jgi:hypothetical protein
VYCSQERSRRSRRLIQGCKLVEALSAGCSCCPFRNMKTKNNSQDSVQRRKESEGELNQEASSATGQSDSELKRRGGGRKSRLQGSNGLDRLETLAHAALY